MAPRLRNIGIHIIGGTPALSVARLACSCMKNGIVITIAICATIIVSAFISLALKTRPTAELCVFDVGQGDALFLQTKNGRQWLIDGGPSPLVLSRLGAKLPPWDRTIDGIILTHPHADHLVGIISVLDRYDVKEIITTDVKYLSPIADILEEAIKREGANVHTALAGVVFEEDDISLRIIFPVVSFNHHSVSNVNESSVVLKLRVDGKEFLLMGDAGEKTEQELIRENKLSHADILKVGHHGSAHGTTSLFLNAIQPAIAIISSGANNRYGHPNTLVLNRLQEVGANIFRTDTDGTVCVTVINGEIHTRTRASWTPWWI